YIPSADRPCGGKSGAIPPDQAQLAERVAYLRDIFGNPFRPVAFSPAWRTENAVALARRMYESREVGAMRLLADVLQEVGCNNEEVLQHCRAAGPHGRGCWVVDMIVGRE